MGSRLGNGDVIIMTKQPTVATVVALADALRDLLPEIRREHDAGDGHFSTEQVANAEQALATYDAYQPSDLVKKLIYAREKLLGVKSRVGSFRTKDQINILATINDAAIALIEAADRIEELEAPQFVTVTDAMVERAWKVVERETVDDDEDYDVVCKRILKHAIEAALTAKAQEEKL